MKQLWPSFLALLVHLCLATTAYAHGDEWKTLNDKYNSLYRQGLYDRAEVVASNELEVAEQAFGPNHPNVAQSLNDLAATYYMQKKNAQAERLQKHAVEIWRMAATSANCNTTANLTDRPIQQKGKPLLSDFPDPFAEEWPATQLQVQAFLFGRVTVEDGFPVGGSERLHNPLTIDAHGQVERRGPLPFGRVLLSRVQFEQPAGATFRPLGLALDNLFHGRPFRVLRFCPRVSERVRKKVGVCQVWPTVAF